ncbi:MAG TPA: hypothetical protein VI583_15330 [Cyclobacteriaceae bacterium]|nr:hypothetical protein [Cyclobacteriaceae bacterium]
MSVFAGLNCVIFLLVVSVSPGISQFKRNVNAVIIENDSLNDLELLNKYAGLIRKSGFDICRMDSASRLLTTNSYFIENRPLLVYYRLNVDGPFALLRAYFMDFSKYSYSPDRHQQPMKWNRISFRSIQGKAWHACFKNMVVFSESLRSGVHGKAIWLEETDHE